MGMTTARHQNQKGCTKRPSIRHNTGKTMERITNNLRMTGRVPAVVGDFRIGRGKDEDSCVKATLIYLGMLRNWASISLLRTCLIESISLGNIVNCACLH